MFHVFTFTKAVEEGEEVLTMAYTTEGAENMDVWAPMRDGWHFSTITTMPKLNESYDSLKELWKRNVVKEE
tara:strand:- start:3216 stop:3428 length:213 start_codon:yes stop_codon:yes gene_type:complete